MGRNRFFLICCSFPLSCEVRFPSQNTGGRFFFREHALFRSAISLRPEARSARYLRYFRAVALPALLFFYLARFLQFLSARCGHLEAIWGHLGRYLKLLSASWGHLGAIWGLLGAILWPSWGHLGVSWAILGPSWWLRSGRSEAH